MGVTTDSLSSFRNSLVWFIQHGNLIDIQDIYDHFSGHFRYGDSESSDQKNPEVGQ